MSLQYLCVEYRLILSEASLREKRMTNGFVQYRDSSIPSLVDINKFQNKKYAIKRDIIKIFYEHD